MSKAFIVYGPPACGKTHNRQLIAEALGANFIIEEWDPRAFLKTGGLHLSATEPSLDFIRSYPGLITLSYKNAMSLAEARETKEPKREKPVYRSPDVPSENFKQFQRR